MADGDVRMVNNTSLQTSTASDTITRNFSLKKAKIMHNSLPVVPPPSPPLIGLSPMTPLAFMGAAHNRA